MSWSAGWQDAMDFWEQLGNPHFLPHLDVLSYWGLSDGESPSLPPPIAANILTTTHVSQIDFGVVTPTPVCEMAVVIPASVEHLKLVYLNTRSLVKHNVEISDFILEKDVDIMAVSETWLHSASNTAADLATPSGFKMLRHDRTHTVGGGVAIIYRDSLDVHMLKSECPDNCNVILFKISINPTTTLTCLLVYRPPPDTSNFEEQLFAIITPHLKDCTRFIVLGDVNYCANDMNDILGISLLKAFTMNDFAQHIVSATHSHGRTLDWLLSHNVLLTDILVTDCPWSDHFFISCSIPLPDLIRKTSNIRQLKMSRNFKKVTPKAFSELILPKLSCINESDDIDMIASTLRTAANITVDILAPERCKILKPETKEKTWFTDTVVHARQLKRSAEKIWKRTPCDLTRASYRLAANDYKKAIIDAKSNHYNSRISAASSNSRELFRIVRELEGNHTLPVHLSNSQCQEIHDAFANKTSKHRESISNKIISLNLSTDDHTSDHNPDVLSGIPNFSFRPVTIEELILVVKSMKPTTCRGDACNASIIQDSIDLLAPFLTKLVNVSFATARVPSCLKESWVSPLLKKPSLDPNDSGNFRPITNVSFFLKILDKLAYLQVIQFLDTYKLLNTRQSGFRANYGTESALLDLKDNLCRLIDRGQPVLLLLLDLSAAFDLVDHKRLVERLKTRFAFSPIAAEWINSFLSDRVVRVFSGSSTSKPSSLVCGVPQGSCLSPVLYNMYTAPLFDTLDRQGVGYTNYADDTQLYLPLSEDYTSDLKLVQATFKKIQTWMACNQLVLNDSKTEILLLGTQHKLTNLPSVYDSFDIEGHPIPTASSVKTLGVWLDANLKMTRQVAQVKSTCAYVLKLLRQIKPFLVQSNLARVAGALVNSRLDYCNSLYAGTSNKNFSTLQVIQNDAARVVMNISKQEHVSRARHSLHWLPIRDRVKHKICSLTHRCLFGKAPDYLKEQIRRQTSSRTLRSSDEIRVKADTFKLSTFGGQRFNVQAALYWNALSKTSRNVSDILAFKKEIKTEFFKPDT